MNWVDFIIVVLIILMAIYGYNRGMFRMLFSIISFVLVIAVAVFAAPMIADKLAENDGTIEAISGYISESLGMEEKMYQMAGETKVPEEETIQQEIEAIKGTKEKKNKEDKTVKTDKTSPAGTAVKTEETIYVDSSLMTDCGFPAFLAEKIFEMSGVDNGISEFKGEAIRTINQKLCDTIAKMIIKIVVFLVIVVVLSIVLSVVARMLGILGRFPGISTLNHVGGTLIGIIEGIIIIWLLGMLVIIFCQMGNGISLLKDIQESGMGRYLMYHNIVITNFL